MKTYRYRTLWNTEGTYQNCIPEDAEIEKEILKERIIPGLEIIERTLKKVPLWDKKLKIYQKKEKKDGGFTKGDLMKPIYNSIFTKQSVALQNSGKHGYEKARQQSPLEVIAGSCRKFAKVIFDDNENLSPDQIHLWNQAINQCLLGNYKDKKGEEFVCGIYHIMADMYQGPRWQDRDLPALTHRDCNFQRLCIQLEGMKIDAVDIEEQEQQEKIDLVKDIQDMIKKEQI